jgi:hypothetical protein
MAIESVDVVGSASCGVGTLAIEGSVMSNTQQPPDIDDDRPLTYFELQRRLSANPELGPSPPKPGDEQLPPLPPDSPWAGDPVGPEPLINRTEDGDTTGSSMTEVDQ